MYAIEFPFITRCQSETPPSQSGTFFPPSNNHSAKSPKGHSRVNW